MGRFTRPTLFPRKKWLLYAAIKIFTLTVLVSAANISVTTRNFQAEFGSAINVASNLLATDKGFSLATSGSSPAGTSCSSAVTFGPVPAIANTTIIAGDLVYDVLVNSTAGAQPNTKYNVTLVLAQNTYGPLCIATPASPTNGQTIDCRFDVGTTLPASPFSFRVTVQ